MNVVFVLILRSVAVYSLNVPRWKLHHLPTDRTRIVRSFKTVPHRLHVHKRKMNFFESDPSNRFPDDNSRETDPIFFLTQELGTMDVNTIVNTSVVVILAVFVLNQLVTVDMGIMRGWSTTEMALRVPIDNWSSYSTVLAQAPVQTKAVTSATVYTIGDFIAQRTEGKTIGKMDRLRILRSMAAGLIGHGPLSHIWYEVSDNLFENVLHLKDWWGTIVKVAIDQSIWGPIWNNTYILLLGLMQFKKLEDVFSEMKRTTIPLIISGLKLWPAAHLVTYGLIPVENRLLWVDLVEIIWVTILATTAASGSHKEKRKEE